MAKRRFSTQYKRILKRYGLPMIRLNWKKVVEEINEQRKRSRGGLVYAIMNADPSKLTKSYLAWDSESWEKLNEPFELKSSETKENNNE